MDEFDFTTITLAPERPLDDTVYGHIPVNEDSPSRAGVYCVIA
ncbi:hypothetical protein BD414DRAFT_582153 [Trametes punicea]|nr:hypothetical protein BD414DRAFT_582153 [Trametes punicea]